MKKARAEAELGAYVVRFSEQFKAYVRAIRLHLGLPLDGLDRRAASTWLADHMAEHRRITREGSFRDAFAASLRSLADSPREPRVSTSKEASKQAIEEIAASDRLWQWRERDERKTPLHQMLVAVFRIFDLPETDLLAGYSVAPVVDRTRAMLSVEAVNGLYSPLARIHRSTDSASITLTGVPDDLSNRKWTSFWTDSIKPVVQREDQLIDATVELAGLPRRADLPWRLRAYELHLELARTIPETLAQVRDEFPGEFASADTPSDEPSRRRKLLDGIAEIRKRVDALDARSRAHSGDAD